MPDITVINTSRRPTVVMQNKTTIRIAANASHLPSKLLTNDDLATLVDTNDEWIVSRTGIKQRFIVDDHESTESLALASVKKLMSQNEQLAGKVPDLIVTATSTPTRFLPSISSFIASECFMGDIMAFDLNAACSGFCYAIHVAHSLMISANLDNALVIGTDTMSRVVDWRDRNTCILFGDGAGCLWLQKDTKPGIVSCYSSGNASNYNSLHATGGYQAPNQHHLTMQGSDVFKVAVKQFVQMTLDTLKQAGKTVAELDWLITHQANYRIIQAVSRQLGIDMNKVVVTVDQHANTSAASLPLAIASAVEKEELQVGDLVLLLAFGAGYTWSSVLMYY